jgi:hypothetical protein
MTDLDQGVIERLDQLHRLVNTTTTTIPRVADVIGNHSVAATRSKSEIEDRRRS